MRQLSKDRLPNKRKDDLFCHATFLRKCGIFGMFFHLILFAYFSKKVDGTLNLCKYLKVCVKNVYNFIRISLHLRNFMCLRVSMGK